MPAFAGDPYTVAGVAVDAKGSTAIAAQTEAILNGQTRAADSLLRRLTLESDRMAANYQPPVSEDATRMIRAMSVANERRSAQRYIGDITVAFVPRAVRAYAESKGLTLLDTQTRERLVLPVAAGRIADPMSASWTIWDTDAHGFSLTPVRLPAGDPIMLQGLNVAGLISGDATAMASAQQDLGTAQLLIAEELSPSRVRLTDVVLDAGVATPLGTVSRRGVDQTVAQSVIAKLTEDWKAANAGVVQAGAGTEQSVQLTVLFDSLGDWQRLQSAIASSARVRGTRLDALSKSGALMSVNYVGTADDLAGELRSKGARLQAHPELGMVIARPGYALP